MTWSRWRLPKERLQAGGLQGAQDLVERGVGVPEHGVCLNDGPARIRA
jgi:hypothetical protein